MLRNLLQKYPTVSGFHIGNIDLLIEDDENQTEITTDYEATIKFLKDLMKEFNDKYVTISSKKPFKTNLIF